MAPSDATPSPATAARSLPGHRRRSSGLWLYGLPTLLLLLAIVWRRFGPVHPGTALAGCALACVVLLVRAAQASRSEQAIWLALALAFFAQEIRLAHRVHILSQSILVGHMEPGGRLALAFGGGPLPLPAVSVFVMDLDGMNRLQAARLEGDAYDPLIQGIALGDVAPGRHLSVAVRPIQPAGAVSHYRLVFYSRQTSWWEDLQTRTHDGHLLQAYRVLAYRGLHPRVLAAYQDPGFTPTPGASPDWAWARREP